ncbi:hypothetical protein AVEN_226986-1 [Araneus ventricosus]|uniref:Uncharacterized protein n=1 Tax=Araneus ventricosus TaxID=182803 RepID=A0A4Y2PZK6_ARAVE|nr:hypothetical protein AVEN_226986-1 [Araneus ventricosus]
MQQVPYTADLRWNRVSNLRPSDPEVETLPLGHRVLCSGRKHVVNGPYAPFGFESIEKQLWRNKQNDRPISDSEIKAVLSQLFKTDHWLTLAGHVSEDVTSHA